MKRRKFEYWSNAKKITHSEACFVLAGYDQLRGAGKFTNAKARMARDGHTEEDIAGINGVVTIMEIK